MQTACPQGHLAQQDRTTVQEQGLTGLTILMSGLPFSPGLVCRTGLDCTLSYGQRLFQITIGQKNRMGQLKQFLLKGRLDLRYWLHRSNQRLAFTQRAEKTAAAAMYRVTGFTVCAPACQCQEPTWRTVVHDQADLPPKTI